GHDVTAIDYSDGMIAKAKQNCAEAGVPANIMKMDAQSLEFEDGTFDLVVSRKVVWNLPDPVRAYKEWLRVLKSGGRMILFDGNYFLGMHDEDYKRSVPFTCGEDNGTYQGADPSILLGFAKDLPLSKARRPQWDVGALTELGVDRVEVLVDTRREESGLPDTFVIIACKDRGGRRARRKPIHVRDQPPRGRPGVGMAQARR
ncbi:MAG: class I SAM-dependent methyltransferase, partial [Candidatus Methanomethylophilaceae archaeon]|nr:class I SAM-dependent methyltransferase [Candidatus Methanomethylophilaceae archaeon]